VGSRGRVGPLELRGCSPALLDQAHQPSRPRPANPLGFRGNPKGGDLDGKFPPHLAPDLGLIGGAKAALDDPPPI
jgi:hypothetical protein